MKYVPKTPWATPDCANTPSWGTADPSACSVVAWQLGYPTPPGQTTGTGVSGIIGVGKFSPDGTPYVTGVVGSQVLSLSTACCAAWNGAGTGGATMLALWGHPCDANGLSDTRTTVLRVVLFGSIITTNCQSPAKCPKPTAPPPT